MALPFERDKISIGRSKVTLGMGASPAGAKRFLMESETGSTATISFRAVPIQMVAPSAERSALVPPGTEICAIRVWLEVENTSTRFIARLATKTCLLAAS